MKTYPRSWEVNPRPVNVEPPANFRPKRSLGQNFLADENVARKIIRAIAPDPADVIVEIGPGLGVLTKHLVETGCQCFAIEIDERLIPGLREQFDAYPNFNLVHADFRKVDLRTLTGTNNLRIIGNIPYHITSHIVFTAFEQRQLLKDVVLMVQKEVAARIVARPGGKDYGILSVISQTFAETELLFSISKNVFRPKPEVDSTMVRWIFRPAPVAIRDESLYLRLVKSVFAQRRKTLRRSLSQFLDLPTDRLHRLPVSIDLQRRPETLTVKELILLANHLGPTTR